MVHRLNNMLDSIKKMFSNEGDEPVNTTGKPDISREKSAELYEKSKTFFPGGVNSPVRAFKSVYGTPLFIAKGDGCHIWDADGNQFIDFCCSWGPLILGHNHPKVREKVTEVMQNGMSFGAPTALENELAEHRHVEKMSVVGDVAVEGFSPEIGLGPRLHGDRACVVAHAGRRIEPLQLGDEVAALEPDLRRLVGRDPLLRMTRRSIGEQGCGQGLLHEGTS